MKGYPIECAICCENIEGATETPGGKLRTVRRIKHDGPAIIHLKKCGHMFHKSCLEKWRTSSQDSCCSSCPMCRGPITEKKSTVSFREDKYINDIFREARTRGVYNVMKIMKMKKRHEALHFIQKMETSAWAEDLFYRKVEKMGYTFEAEAEAEAEAETETETETDEDSSIYDDIPDLEYLIEEDIRQSNFLDITASVSAGQ